ncbi:hypothetical protein B0T24DRAFT_685613 [Lasiosphaeria ovina]|uniref:Uncharacterized protein n=1 Tax=Lasiosphaeria ovina TaxID=92902 RepID=A0AAE0MYN5_9PEZI|nr:hypothetical protein B0T24DRAFT_685613 [Lasiosphaeria ovina]
MRKRGRPNQEQDQQDQEAQVTDALALPANRNPTAETPADVVKRAVTTGPHPAYLLRTLSPDLVDPFQGSDGPHQPAGTIPIYTLPVSHITAVIPHMRLRCTRLMTRGAIYVETMDRESMSLAIRDVGFRNIIMLEASRHLAGAHPPGSPQKQRFGDVPTRYKVVCVQALDAAISSAQTARSFSERVVLGLAGCVPGACAEGVDDGGDYMGHPTIAHGSRVLVTGATGYLATHITKQLLERGFHVRGTVRDLQTASWLTADLFKEARSRGHFELAKDSPGLSYLDILRSTLVSVADASSLGLAPSLSTHVESTLKELEADIQSLQETANGSASQATGNVREIKWRRKRGRIQMHHDRIRRRRTDLAHAVELLQPAQGQSQAVLLLGIQESTRLGLDTTGRMMEASTDRITLSIDDIAAPGQISALDSGAAPPELVMTEQQGPQQIFRAFATLRRQCPKRRQLWFASSTFLAYLQPLFGVLHHGEVLFADGFGCLDATEARRPTADTVYGIGSLTNCFVASSLAKLFYDASRCRG